MVMGASAGARATVSELSAKTNASSAPSSHASANGGRPRGVPPEHARTIEPVASPKGPNDADLGFGFLESRVHQGLPPYLDPPPILIDARRATCAFGTLARASP